MFRVHPAAFVLAAAALLFGVSSPALALDDPGAIPVHLLARGAAAEPPAVGFPRAHETPPGRAGETLPAPTFHVEVKGVDDRPAALPVLYGSLVVMQGLDFYTTRRGLALGARESNPLIRNGNPATTIALKAASTGVTILIAEKMWRRNRTGAIALMAATNLVFGAVVSNNVRVIGRLR